MKSYNLHENFEEIWKTQSAEFCLQSDVISALDYRILCQNSTFGGDKYTLCQSQFGQRISTHIADPEKYMRYPTNKTINQVFKKGTEQHLNRNGKRC